MLKLSDKASGQNGAKILLDAMSKDKVHLPRFILDALDGEIVHSATAGATTPLITSVLLPEARARFTSPLLLLRRGAHVNRRDEHGRTALSHACESGHLDAVRALVQNSADPEVVDVWGNSALMYACVAGHASVVDFLVRAFKRLGGLQIDRQNKVGNSAVEVAKHLGHRDCVLALTGRAKRSRESAAIARRGSERDPDEDNFGTKSWDALEVFVAQSESHVVCPEKGGNTAKIDELCFEATSEGRKSSVVRSRMRSMDSIEEFERECDGAPTASAVLSDACAPSPHARSFQPQRGISTMRAGEIISRHFQPSSRCPDPQFPPLFSPRPAKNASNRGACTGATSARPVSSSPLEILLTPIPGHDGGEKNQQETESEARKKKTAFDFGLRRRFDDGYYEKRCSLPTSVLGPAPRDRCAPPMPSRKPSKPALKGARLGSGGTQNTFTVLGNKLLRRFTFPQFRKSAKAPGGDGGGGGGDGGGGDGDDGWAAALSGSPRAMPRSETFPLAQRHAQIGSKPSIDSISAVKCEFDFQLKVNPF